MKVLGTGVYHTKHLLLFFIWGIQTTNPGGAQLRADKGGDANSLKFENNLAALFKISALVCTLFLLLQARAPTSLFRRLTTPPPSNWSQALS